MHLEQDTGLQSHEHCERLQIKPAYRSAGVWTHPPLPAFKHTPLGHIPPTTTRTLGSRSASKTLQPPSTFHKAPSGAKREMPLTVAFTPMQPAHREGAQVGSYSLPSSSQTISGSSLKRNWKTHPMSRLPAGDTSLPWPTARPPPDRRTYAPSAL